MPTRTIETDYHDRFVSRLSGDELDVKAAPGLRLAPDLPIFTDGKITLQPIRRRMDDPRVQATSKRYTDNVRPALQNLQRLARAGN